MNAVLDVDGHFLYLDRDSFFKRDEDFIAGYVGDKRTLDQLRSRFREVRYLDVIRLAKELKYPSRMTPSERG